MKTTKQQINNQCEHGGARGEQMGSKPRYPAERADSSGGVFLGDGSVDIDSNRLVKL